ncbi:energy transducer TonB [Tenacibaculum sp. S7007]|uniref:Energy transducer TonB n=1 Tax=Tenacibaculum pelagium TaxID=2759527 RepID=A0A839ANG0_9FLAO|nr:energy transducer TonB [Tenacibaculum pelagium]MBA6155900.1 energy transducer TonB [Tenacibaculum pelagium]
MKNIIRRVFILSLLFLTFSISSQNSKEVEIVDETVPFKFLEEVPVFPGCIGSKAEKKACLNKSMQLHIVKYFNIELAENLDLDPGKKRIYIQFKIDKKGLIEDVNVTAPHAKLKEESIRVIKLLPAMIPGKQKGVPVRVAYTLPITFKVKGKKRKNR